MKLQLVLGDITTQHVDVIVNAANSSLLGGVVSTVPSTEPQAPSSFRHVGCSAVARPAKPRRHRGSCSLPVGSFTPSVRSGAAVITASPNC